MSFHVASSSSVETLWIISRSRRKACLGHAPAAARLGASLLVATLISSPSSQPSYKLARSYRSATRQRAGNLAECAKDASLLELAKFHLPACGRSLSMAAVPACG